MLPQHLRSFELAGRASTIDLTLLLLTGVAPIRVAGGMSAVATHRPPRVAARLTVKGAAAQTILDDQRGKGAGNLFLETPGARSAPARCEIEITGGACRVTLDSR